MSERGIKYDSDKVRYDLVEPQFLKMVAEVLTIGAKKYADDNWKKVENKRARYTAATMRHFEDWRMGNIYDDESGLPHLAHAACNLMFLIWIDHAEKDSPF